MLVTKIIFKRAKCNISWLSILARFNKLLKLSTDFSKSMIERELHYNLDRLMDKWHQQSLEITFISKKIYRKMEVSDGQFICIYGI